MDALNDQGMFWVVSEKKVNFDIPKETVSGNLTISEEGVIALVLDGIFPRNSFADEMNGRGEVLSKHVVLGVLKGKSERVILMGLRRGEYKYSFGGFCYEGFRAEYCLVGGFREISNVFDIKVAGLSVDLNSHSDWLAHDLFCPSEKAGVHSVEITLPKKYESKISKGVRLSIDGDYYGEFEQINGAKKLALHASLIWNLKFRSAVALDDAYAYYKATSELFMLLSASGTRLDWPKVQIGRGKTKKFANFYFYRPKDSDIAPREHYGFVFYEDISLGIGQLFQNWLDLKAKVGAGCHLFFLLLSPGQTYIEHMYVSAIWGLECYHRRQYGDHREKKSDKGERIKEAIDTLSQLKSDERRTLKASVDRAVEYSLQDRLLSLFNSLPVMFEKESMNDFCKACADRRNDISHYGGYRTVGSGHEQGDFNEELLIKSIVLKYLYGALLLKGIGIDDELIAGFFKYGAESGWVRRNFEAVGLKTIQAAEADD